MRFSWTQSAQNPDSDTDQHQDESRTSPVSGSHGDGDEEGPSSDLAEAGPDLVLELRHNLNLAVAAGQGLFSPFLFFYEVFLIFAGGGPGV